MIQHQKIELKNRKFLKFCLMFLKFIITTLRIYVLTYFGFRSALAFNDLPHNYTSNN